MAATQIFHSEGREFYHKLFNGQQSPLATLYVLLRRLDGAGGRPADAAAADTLSSNLSECSGSGYSRQSVTVNSTNCPVSAVSADYRMTIAQVTFAFTGTITGITHAAVASTSDGTGKLLYSAPLSTTRNVANGDSIKVTFQFDLTQGA